MNQDVRLLMSRLKAHNKCVFSLRETWMISRPKERELVPQGFTTLKLVCQFCLCFRVIFPECKTGEQPEKQVSGFPTHHSGSSAYVLCQRGSRLHVSP